jgi:hypothetical protein
MHFKLIVSCVFSMLVVIYLLEKKNNRMVVLHNPESNTTIFKTSNGLISKHPNSQELFLRKLAFVFLKLRIQRIGLVMSGKFTRAYFRKFRDLGPNLVFAVNQNLFAYNGCRFSITRRL